MRSCAGHHKTGPVRLFAFLYRFSAGVKQFKIFTKIENRFIHLNKYYIHYKSRFQFEEKTVSVLFSISFLTVIFQEWASWLWCYIQYRAFQVRPKIFPVSTFILSECCWCMLSYWRTGPFRSSDIPKNIISASLIPYLLHTDIFSSLFQVQDLCKWHSFDNISYIGYQLYHGSMSHILKLP